MANFITSFETHAEYESATSIQYPNVSVINEDMSVIYEKEDPFDGKYKFVLSNGTIITGRCDISSAITSADTVAYKSTLVDAKIGKCVTTLASTAFFFLDELTSVTIPSSVTSIGSRAFAFSKKLEKLEIPYGVTRLEGSIAAECSRLSSVTIPNTVTYIGQHAFYLTKLASVVIPSGVTFIELEAFRDCRSLRSITVEATTPPLLATAVFYGCSDYTIYVPSESLEAYKKNYYWSGYASRIQAIPE